MKKSFLSLSLALLASLILFTGCKNFLCGSELKSSLEQSIIRASAENGNAIITIINNNHGYLLQEGKTDIKVGVPYNLTVEEDARYVFQRWVAFSNNDSYIKQYIRHITDSASFELEYDQANTSFLPSTKVSFSNPTSLSTTVTVNTSEGIVIVPLFYKRPAVVNYSHNDASKVYSWKNKIIIEFNKPINEDKLLLKGCEYTYHQQYSSSKRYSPCNLLNPEYAYILLQPKGSDTEMKVAIEYFFASVQGNKLILEPHYGQDDFHYGIGDNLYYKLLVSDNVPDIVKDHIRTQLEKHEKQYSYEYYSGFVEDYYLRTENNLDYQQVTIHFTGLIEDVNGIKANISNEYSWYRGGTSNDTIPPIITDAWALHTQTGKFNFMGGTENKIAKYNSKGLYISKTLYSIEDIKDQGFKMKDPAKSNSFDNLPLIPHLLSVNSNRVKDYLYLYVKAKDTNDSLENIDYGVSFITYSITQITNSDGTVVSYTPKTDTIKYEDKQAYFYNYVYDVLSTEGWDIKNIVPDNGGMWISLDLSGVRDYPSGLYYLELYATDLNDNKGCFNPITETNYTFTSKKSYSDSKNVGYSKHVIQYWFYLDREEPDVSQATYDNTPALKPEQKWYGPNTYKNFILPKDGTNITDSKRVIKDGGNDRFNTGESWNGYDPNIEVKTYRNDSVFRYCEIWNNQVSSVTINYNYYSNEKINSPIWQETYTDYDFTKLGSEFDRFVSYLPTGKHNVWVWHRDAVGNLSSTSNGIKIENAFWYDNTVPTASGTYLSDGGGIGVHLTNLTESHSGLYKIHYDIVDSNGKSYNLYKIYLYSGYSISNNSITQGYYTNDIISIDTENKVITFTNPLFNSNSTGTMDLYVKDYISGTNATAKIWLEDAAGNLSSEITVQLQ